MATKLQKTHSTTPSGVSRRWWLIDAENQVLGRVAATAAHLLRGKHKAVYAPHLDTGDHVVVVNAAKIRLTGNKPQDKIWYRHSGYPGGMRKIRYEQLLERSPATAIEKAVQGMLPHNRLGRSMAGKLKVYPGPTHPHKAQAPVSWTGAEDAASGDNKEGK